MNIEAVAQICHEANRAYCRTLGDTSQRLWSDASEWQRDSAVDGVRFVLAHPGAGVPALHENWWADKKRDGWEYGPEKDEIAKQHPCMVPFHKLPAEQQAKDHLFHGIVHGLQDFIEID